MIGIVILNIVLSSFVVVGMLALLGWAIVTNRSWMAAIRRDAHRRRRQAARASLPAGGRLRRAGQLS
jgi:Tfp pilus assembly protein PilX